MSGVGGGGGDGTVIFLYTSKYSSVYKNITRAPKKNINSFMERGRLIVYYI